MQGLQYGQAVDMYYVAGGTVPLAATLATEQVFEAFKSSSKVDALLHGHSYSGYPIGCAAAVEALRLMSSPQNPALCIPERSVASLLQLLLQACSLHFEKVCRYCSA